MKVSPRSYATSFLQAVLAQPDQTSRLVNIFWQKVFASKHYSWRRRILAEVAQAWHDLSGEQEVTVVSSHTLTAAERSEIEQKLCEQLPRFCVDWEVKPHLFGGLVITIDGVRYDASLKGQLDRLYHHLANN